MNKLKRGLAVLFSAAALAAVAVPAQADDGIIFDTSFKYQIQNINSGQCVVTQGYTEGARAFQYYCDNYDDQKWWFHPDSGDVGFQVSNENSAQCLEVADWRTDNGAPVRQWTCTGGANQKWKIRSNGWAGWELINMYSGKCLVIQNLNPGSQAFQYDCNPAWIDQLWRLRQA
ncbi:RICIN domain-containing protein [Kitasatospora sp. NPDC049285]|uniref:RICIN domain-containing protein n=1 Tax=Kitasatospora sp. NPDC049285 TaxID=3157096 RepID=UPI00343AB25E